MTKKNIIFISVSLVLIILLGIGVSYSMWNITTSQDTNNTAYTDCFDLTISNKSNDISLENAYPISNDKGMKLTPYTFTVTNTCDITAQYSINLEVLKDSTLSSNFIDVMLDGNINLLSSYDKTEKIDNSSIESRKIDTGILKSNESKDYSLRLWIDYDTTLEDLNNEAKVFKAKVNIVGKPINYTGDTVFNFDYTGSEQVFTVPVSGTYKVELWGAEGGGYDENKTGGSGGYNGGGSLSPQIEQDSRFYSSGGGASHISLVSGVLSSLENHKSEILIVAGGGGGSYYDKKLENYNMGGSGGGFKGNNGVYVTLGWGIAGYGGTQEKAGYSVCDDRTCYADKNKIIKSIYGIGSFGKGGDSDYKNPSTGGGGGFYGGGGSVHVQSAGGGSGYIGNTLLTNKIMYCYNCEESNDESTKTISTTCNEETPTSYCAKKGNGYARITLVSID